MVLYFKGKCTHFSPLYTLKYFHQNLTGFLAQQMSFGRRFQHLLSFLELWYFNAKVCYYCSFDILYTVQETGVIMLKNTVLSCLNKHY